MVEEESYIQSLIAERLGGASFGKSTAIYKFEKIKRAKAAAMKAHPGVELIDLGVGEPDEVAPPGVVETLRIEADKPENRGYTNNGIMAFREAAACYMEKVYGVRGLNPATQIVHCIGAKPALAMMPAVLINPGDISLMTVPGYPVLGTYTRYYGGRTYEVPLRETNDFLPDLESLPAEVLSQAKILYLNYPNNPTGASATSEFFQKVVAFAEKNNLVVVHDAAYAALSFESQPLSFLSVPGAQEVGVEVHSLSKAFNMTGWRLGFVCGNPLLVEGYATIKDNTDSGQFAAIQKAGIHCLEHPELTQPIAAKYERRLRALVELLAKLGFTTRMPRGSFFMYTGIPEGIAGGRRFETAEEFSQWLITEKLISTVPWDDVGHYVRLSATFVAPGEAEERCVLGEIERRLGDVKFEFSGCQR